MLSKTQTSKIFAQSATTLSYPMGHYDRVSDILYSTLQKFTKFIKFIRQQGTKSINSADNLLPEIAFNAITVCLSLIYLIFFSDDM